MNLVLSTFAVAAVLFVGGALVFAVIMKDYFGREFAPIFRPPAELKLGWVVVEKLAQGLLLSILYRHVTPMAASPLCNGLAFGALVGGLIEMTYLFTTWVNYRVAFAPVAINTAFGFARMLVAGLVLGAIVGHS